MISRRSFIKAIAATTVFYPFRNVFASQKTERTLNLYNIHTDERLDINYFFSGTYDNEALEKINHLLRCHYTGQINAIDIRVLDLLCDIKDTAGKNKQLQIISGYRSPEYNEHLRSHGRKIAKDSLHIHGLAIDFSIDGVSKNTLSRIAKTFNAGGVGKYRKFVHIDVGPVRYW